MPSGLPTNRDGIVAPIALVAAEVQTWISAPGIAAIVVLLERLSLGDTRVSVERDGDCMRAMSSTPQTTWKNEGDLVPNIPPGSVAIGAPGALSGEQLRFQLGHLDFDDDKLFDLPLPSAPPTSAVGSTRGSLRVAALSAATSWSLDRCRTLCRAAAAFRSASGTYVLSTSTLAVLTPAFTLRRSRRTPSSICEPSWFPCLRTMWMFAVASSTSPPIARRLR